MADGDGASPFWPQQMLVRGVLAGGGGYTTNFHTIVRGLTALGVGVCARDLRSSKISRLSGTPLARYAACRPGARVVLSIVQPLWAQPITMATVNYSMYEADRVPAEWVRFIRRMPLSIVPSRHCEGLWLAAGAAPERVRIVPHGIDGARFAAPCEPLPLPVAVDGRNVAGRRVRFLTRAGGDRRKNIGGLLGAWLAATRAGDDAVLIIKAQQPGPGDPDVVAQALEEAPRRAGRALADAAPVVVLREDLPDADMPRLYAAATHFVSASHGEGWDLPMTEAGAAGLTLIAPDHTGYREYLDSTVATMIPSALVDVESGTGHFFDGLRWWEPDHAALVAAIRAAVAGESLARGAQARILADFTVERATVSLLDAIGGALPEVVAGD
jgi:glycosyltransferase involved in cell wall biosynthesis